MTLGSRRAGRLLRIRGRALHVVEAGSGPALLLLHGWQMSWRAWFPQIQAFAQRHHVIAPDLPGFGHSAPYAGEYPSIPDYADTMAQVLDQLEVPQCVVVGNSMGGFIGTEMALRHPRRIAGLVLVAAAGVSDRYLFPKELIRHPIGVQCSRLIFGGGGWSRRLAQAAWPLVWRGTFAQPLRMERALLEAQRLEIGAAGAHQAAMACARHEHRQQLGALQCPTLIVWGQKDLLQPVSNAQRYASAIPRARLRIYEGIGHCPQLEDAERFNLDLMDFLAVAFPDPKGHGVEPSVLPVASQARHSPDAGRSARS